MMNLAASKIVALTMAAGCLAGPAALAQAPAAAPASREFLYQGEATSILGRKVFDPSGALVGRIIDVLVGDAGLPRAAVIDFGGFMGVGNRRVAVAWSSLHFDPATRRIGFAMTMDQIRAIPQFRQPARPADPPTSVAVPPPSPAAPTPPPQRP